MKSIAVQIPAEPGKRYEIVFFDDHDELLKSLESHLEHGYLVVTDENVHRCHADFFAHFDDKVLVLKPGEATKRFESVEKILNKGFELGLNRESKMIAIGGGVVGDITGFAASVFMRGIGCVQVPTSLLAMVDSSVGGKTGVDNQYGKNLVGSFHQPETVLVDFSFLETLPEKEVKNGLCEMIKHGILGSERHFSDLEQLSVTSYQLSDIQAVIPDSIQVKRAVVEADEKEAGLRGHLNLGHTYGHAIEHLSHYQVPHGQGVAMGCVLAAEKALEIGWIEEETCERIHQIFQNFEIETQSPYSTDELLTAMKLDKKAKDGNTRLILPKAIGEVDYYEL